MGEGLVWCPRLADITSVHHEEAMRSRQYVCFLVVYFPIRLIQLVRWYAQNIMYHLTLVP